MLRQRVGSAGTFPRRRSSSSRTPPDPGRCALTAGVRGVGSVSRHSYRVRGSSCSVVGSSVAAPSLPKGLKIVGSVTAEGLVEVNGHIEGDLHCTSLVISPKASIAGGIEADSIVVNGRVEGPIRGGEVVLKRNAHVVGDIQHQTLAVEAGRLFRRALDADAGDERAAHREVRREAAERARACCARAGCRHRGVSRRSACMSVVVMPAKAGIQ